MNAPLPADPVLDHNEAWSLAHYKREHSNMARCYIDAINVLRELHGALRKAWDDRTLPASVVSADLTQRTAAIVSKVDE
jgi:hypothetical protein